VLKSIDSNTSPRKEKKNQECENINSINCVSNTGSNLTKKNEFKKLSVKHQVTF
jgi:hypothetical protein